MFRTALAEIGRILTYEAARDFMPTMDTVVESPLGEAEGTLVDITRPVKVIAILQGGLALEEHLKTVLPACETYHVGCSRDEKTLEASIYFNGLPSSFKSDDPIIILDPILATGATIMTVLEEVAKRGATASNIRVISAVAAPAALQKMSPAYPGMAVYAAMIDSEVDDKGYVLPGLGDVSKRAFG